ncbi:protein SRC2 homolog [Manihot esculenta]|uniref:Uncharacterized protein n=1 Tax=Manihot esculenta TaxID=3983 RepID=A0ACB7GVQ6_MANES|nr:protein SRC2 homolog [Manihot esculenta]KAG8643850.1 hypothetical protein MANES_11G073400v8 [Manihot esculenta]
MDLKSLELKLMYCKDLQAFNFFQKLLVYVLVSLESDDPDKKINQNQKQKTPTDAEGDGNPEWNHEMYFDLSKVSFVNCDHLFIHFDLCHEGLLFGDKTIGEVRVPLKCLIQDSSEIVRFVNYQVRSPDGQPNGFLNFSYTVHAKAEISGYSAVVHHQHQSPESLSPEIHHYPSPQFETYPAAQVWYPSHDYPPAPHAYYHPPPMPLPPPPPPPFPLLNHPPPPLPPHPHGICYHPPGFQPWTPTGRYDVHSVLRNWRSTGRESQSYWHSYWNRR